MGLFYIHDDLKKHRHCATLSLFRQDFDSQRGNLPLPTDPTGTVTFVQWDGKTYAITAAHVIEELDRLAAAEGILPVYQCPVGRRVRISGPFIRPTPPFGERSAPDVAICPIDERLPAYIGKSAYVLSKLDKHDNFLTHAIAQGFPTGLKYDSSQDGGTRLTMPSATAIAANPGSSDQYNATISFHSNLDEHPSISSLSGMSGGPVFWAKNGTYGLLGFVKQNLGAPPSGAPTPEPSEEQQNEGDLLSKEKMVHFTIEKAWHNRIVDWLAEVDEKHPAARANRHLQFEAINAEPKRTLDEFMQDNLD